VESQHVQSTRLTELLKVKHPILLAPMDVVSDGRLAATVSRAGDLGIIARGYGHEDQEVGEA
jgi:nitronate monooxygenase